MSSESSPASSLSNTDSASIEGLEDFFEESTTLHSDGGLTIKQAVHYFNLSARKIKKGIKKGEIAATYHEGDKGSSWRVFPNGVPDRLSERLYVPQLPALIEPPITVANAVVQEVNELRSLVLHLTERLERLESEQEHRLFLQQNLQAPATRKRNKPVSAVQPPNDMIFAPPTDDHVAFEQEPDAYDQPAPAEQDNNEVLMISAKEVESPKMTLLNRLRGWLRK